MNTGIQKLVEAYVTQDALAAALSDASGELVHQSRISRWLLEQIDIPVEWVPILLHVGQSAGIEVSPAELRPDVARVFGSD